MGYCITGASTFQPNWGLNHLLQETVYTYLCQLVICVHVVLNKQVKWVILIASSGDGLGISLVHMLSQLLCYYGLLTVPHGFL